MEIPENGACIFKNKPTVEVLIFKKISHRLKDLIIILKEGKLSILRRIDPEIVDEKERFFKDFVIFELPNSIVNTHFEGDTQKIEEKVVSQIVLPN